MSKNQRFVFIVNGYTEGKFSDERATFTQELPVMPDVGDVVLLEPGPTWGQIWCVVERRVIDSVQVTLLSRLVSNEDRFNLALVGEHLIRAPL